MFVVVEEQLAAAVREMVAVDLVLGLGIRSLVALEGCGFSMLREDVVGKQ